MELAEICGFEAESCEVAAEPTFALACVPFEPLSACALTLTTGVEADAEAVVCEGVELTLACVEAGGVVAPVEAETAGGAAWAVAVTDADAAGALTLTVALAAGAGVVATDAVAETVGVAGVPGKPSA